MVLRFVSVQIRTRSNSILHVAFSLNIPDVIMTMFHVLQKNELLTDVYCSTIEFVMIVFTRCNKSIVSWKNHVFICGNKMNTIFQQIVDSFVEFVVTVVGVKTVKNTANLKISKLIYQRDLLIIDNLYIVCLSTSGSKS